MSPDADPHSVREQTDESLRAEREKADQALEENVAAVDRTADAVITRARVRADELLARSRATTDDRVSPHGSATQVPNAVQSERAREDEILRHERAVADESLLQERAAKVALLTPEREETDKDLLSERTRADDALATRDDFLRIVSHDLRNLLGAVLTSGSLLEKIADEAGQGERRLLHAQRLVRVAARMNRLVGDLVDVASIEAGRLAVTLESADAAEVVSEVVELFEEQAAANGLAIVAEIVPPLPPAAFDPARILQVITNLVGNAVKFTPAGGRVVVRVESAAEELHFAVTDTGIGLPPDKLDAVFDRFVQVTKNDRRGVGLGLYISKCIVQGHGGRIWAESELGRGSTFRFSLPAQPRP